MVNKKRSDAGKTRKFSPEELLEAINQVLASFRAKGRWHKSDLYRECIINGLFNKSAMAPTTFYRFVSEYELLKPEEECQNKLRMAFSMQYTNQLWQADTMFGPHLIESYRSSEPILLRIGFRVILRRNDLGYLIIGIV